MTKAVYPGSFDPITKGHLDIIKRGAEVFDILIVAVLMNSEKKGMFSIEERVDLIKRATAKYKNVKVVSFNGLLVDFMEENNIKVLLKGLRTSVDFEYELQMASVNHILSEEVETIFMMSRPENSFISSTIVKEVAKHNGSIKKLVPEEIEDIILNRIEELRR